VHRFLSQFQDPRVVCRRFFVAGLVDHGLSQAVQGLEPRFQGRFVLIGGGPTLHGQLV
jgi:hypothetical protein